MLNKLMSILGTGNILTEDVIKKGLQKIDPRLKKFFSESSKYGYPAGAAIGFLKSELSGKNELPIDRNARPDESANREIKRQEELPAQLVGSAAKIGAGAALGGLGGAALSGVSSLLNQPQSQIDQQQQAPMPEPGPREKALKRHAEMNKKKKLIDQLQQEFENEYGQGNVPPSGLSTASQGSNVNERIQQAAPGGGKSELIQALMEVKKILQ